MAATPITIKRRNNDNTDWDVINPATTISQVSGLETRLETIEEIAQGKEQAYATLLFTADTSNYYLLFTNQPEDYVIGNNYTTQALNDVPYKIQIQPTSSQISINLLYPYLLLLVPSDSSGSPWKLLNILNMSNTPSEDYDNIKLGDNLYIINLGFPDFWCSVLTNSASGLQILETEKPNLSGYVPTSRTIANQELSADISASDLRSALNVADGAEVNVQANWNETNTSSDAYIQNKPTIPTVNNASLNIQASGTTASTFTANASSDVSLNIKSGSTGLSVSKSANNEITISYTEQHQGTVTGSSLTSGQIVVGDGNSAIKISSYTPVGSGTSWNTGSDLYIPTMKSISTYVTGLGYTSNTGTVTSVGIATSTANNGLSVSGTVTTSGSLSVGFASNHSTVLWADSAPGSGVVAGQICFEY